MEMHITNRNKTPAVRETIYDRCAYVGCYNGKFINGQRLFHFPAETDHRLEVWIERSGNFRLRTWAATSLRKAGLCGDHFDDESFTNETRIALKRNVLPRHFTEDLQIRRANQRNQESKRIKKIMQSEEEDVSQRGDRPLALSEGFPGAARTKNPKLYDRSSLQWGDCGFEHVIRIAERPRSPSPLVEYIVEELDESLIGLKPPSPSSIGVPGSEEAAQGETDSNETNGADFAGSLAQEPLEIPEGSPPEEIEPEPNPSGPDAETDDPSTNNTDPALEETDQEAPPDETDLEVASDETEQLPTFYISDKLDGSGSEPPVIREILRLNMDRCSNRKHEVVLANLRNENKQFRQKVRLLRQSLRRSKAREANFMRVRAMLKNIDEFLNMHQCTNPLARSMVKLALHKPKTPYSKEERDFAMHLYRSSAAAFLKLRRAGCRFPGISTIKRWVEDEDGVQRERPTPDGAESVEGEKETFADEDDERFEDLADEPNPETDVNDDYRVNYHPEVMICTNEAVEGAEVTIDDLVDNSEAQEVYFEALPPEDENEDG